MSGRPSLRRAALLVAAGIGALMTAFVSSSAAQTDSGDVPLLAFNLLGDSDAISMQGGQQASQGYPQAVSQTAHTETRVITGPNSSALASMQWPGQFLGNLGSLIQAFGGPPEAGNLNYPVRAEASSSGTRRAEDNGAVAEAEDGAARATARVDGFDDGADFLSFGDARTVSRSALEGPLATTTTSATVTDIVLGGGAITIDSVVTRASVSTDGVQGVATGETTVTGLEVGGQPATVDENGVRFAGSETPNPVDAVGQSVVDDALANFSDGFTVEMYLSEPTVRDEGGLQEYRSGSLVIVMTFGDPKGDGGDGAFLIGGSNAYAQATQGFPPPELAAPPATTPAPQPSQGTGVAPAPSAGSVTASTPERSEVGEVGEVTDGSERRVPILATPISRFAGVPFLVLFLVLLASALIGRGLHLLHSALANAPPATACTDRGADR